MQVCGGSGYTKDWGIEQYYRDTRITMIYEGTNHIQALDLLGRKLPMKGGRLMQVFNERVTDADPPQRRTARNGGVRGAPQGRLQEAHRHHHGARRQGHGGRKRRPGAAASNYLNVFALTALAYVWCVQLEKALSEDSNFAKTKVKTARYFFENVLPEQDSLLTIIRAGKKNLMALDASEFETA
jgi:hypothetical protein